MKKLTLIILLIITLFLTFGCGGKKTIGPKIQPSTHEETSQVNELGIQDKIPWKTAIEDNPVVESDDVPMLKAQAREFQQSKNHKQAIAYLKKAKSLKPDDLSIRELLAISYNEVGKTEEACNELKALVEEKPDNNLRIQYASFLRKAGKFDDAVNTIEDVRAVDPENVTALIELGRIFTMQELYAEAIETFREITYIDNSNALARYYQAEIYLAQNKPLWADKYYKDALRHNPQLGLAEYGLAKIAKLRKSEDTYQQHLTRAYELSPEDEEIMQAYNNQ